MKINGTQIPDLEADRQAAARWAFDLARRDDWCVLDTETSGLDDQAEIVEIAVCSPRGDVLLETRVRPVGEISPVASQIHGLYAENLEFAPTFDRVLVPLLKAVGGRDIVIYNASFDLRLIQQSLRPYGASLPAEQTATGLVWAGAPVHCAMRWYAQWCGQWNPKFGSYTWQKLPGGDHTALGDARATVEIIQVMSRTWRRQDAG